jgi:hypothetical protein
MQPQKCFPALITHQYYEEREGRRFISGGSLWIEFATDKIDEKQVTAP